MENIIKNGETPTPKKRTAADIALEAYKNLGKNTPETYTPGVSSDLDLEKTSANLGIANRPGLGENYINERNNQVIQQKAYNEAKKKADEQGFFGEMLGSLAQATVGEIIGGGIEGIGYLVDPTQLTELEEGSQSLGKMISDFGKATRETTQELAPVYVNPDIQGSFAPWKSEWYFSNLPSVASFVSILAPVAGAAKLASLAGEGLSTLNTLGKAGRIGKETKILSSTIDKISDVLKAAPQSAGTRAVLSTHIEAMMEATQSFQEEYEKLKESGLDDAKARELAGETASFVYKANYANLATEFLQQKLLLRGPRLAKEVDGIKMAQAAGLNTIAGIKGAAKGLFATGGSEAIEEAYQFGVQEEGKYLADVKAGLTEEKDFTERLASYSKNAELWTSAFFGAFGGVAMQTLGPKINESIQKNLLKNSANTFITEKQARINDLNSQKERIMQSVSAYSQAVKTGNEDAINAAKSKMSFDLGVSAAKNGNLQFMLERFNNLKNLSPEEKQQMQIEEDTPLMVDDIKGDINRAAELWKENTIRYGEEFAESISYREFHLEKLNKQLPDVKQRYDNLIMKLPRYNEISVEGKNIIEGKIAIEGLKRSVEALQWRHDNQEMPEFEKGKLNYAIQEAKSNLAKQEALFDASYNTIKSTLNDADNLILKTLNGKQGEDLAKIKSLNNLYNFQINAYTEELNYLTSKDNLKKERERFEAGRKAVEEQVKKQKLQEDIDNEDFTESNVATESAIGVEELVAGIDKGEINENDLSDDVKALIKNFRESGNVQQTSEATQEDLTEPSEEGSTNLEDILNKRTKATENKVVSESVITEHETSKNDEDELQFFGVDETDIDVRLKTINAIAWKSINNKRTLDSEKTPKLKALSDYLETNYDTTNIQLRFSIDEEYLQSIPHKAFPEINSALKNKTIPKNIGKLPIKISFYENGKPLEYEGQLIEAHLHEDDFTNYAPEIQEAARKQIIEEKTEILEAYYKGKTLSSNIIGKSNGHINTVIGKGGKMAQFPLTELYANISDIQFTFGSNDMFLDPNTKSTDLDIMSYKVTNGAIYAKVTTANGNKFPLRLNAVGINEHEAELIYNLYADILSSEDKYTENISPAIIEYIVSHRDSVINQLPNYLDLNNITYRKLLDNLVFNGFSKTKDKKESRLFIAPERVDKDGKKIPKTVYFGNKAYLEKSLFLTEEGKSRFIKYLKENRRRQIDVSLLTNESYKKYIVTNSKLVSNAKPNDKGRIFVQPTVTYNPKFKEVIETPITDTKKSSIPLTITSQVRQQLYDLGYSKADVDNMKPEEGISIIESQKTKVKVVENPVIENIDTESDVAEDNAFDLETILAKATPVEPIVEETKFKESPVADKEKEDIKAERRRIALEKRNKGNGSAFKLYDTNNIKQNKNIIGNEAKHIQSLLPKDIAIKIQKDYIEVLNNGEVAVGLFKDNMIYLTNNAPTGTAYHEAFHAVFRTMVSEKESNFIFEEAELYYHNPSTEEINKIKALHKVDNIEAKKIWLEENLADDFASYMNNTQSNVFSYPKAIKGLFERLLDWIKSVFSNKTTIKKLFDDINKGKYAKKKPNFSRDVRYRTLVQLPTTNDTFTPEDIKEITQQLTFAVLKEVSNINELKNINIEKIKDTLDDLIATAVETDNEELENRANKVYDNLTYFVHEVQQYIGLLGIEKEDDQTEDDNGNPIHKSSYEVSGKQNATKNIKFLIGLTPKFKSYNVVTKEKVYDTENTYLGLPKFANASVTWNKLEKHLSGIVPVMKNGTLIDSFELMLNKLDELSKYHVELGYIKNQLLASDTQTQTEFHATFSRYKGNYIDTLVSGTAKQMTVKFTNSDSHSKEKAIANIWAYNFRKNFGKYEGKKLMYDPIKLDAFKQKYALLRSSINQDKNLNKKITPTTLGLLNSVIQNLGINISEAGLYKWLEEQPVNENITNEEQKLISKVDAFILKLDRSLMGSKESHSLFPTRDTVGRVGELTDKNNHLLDQKFFYEELASQEAEFQQINGESTIIGPDGNKIWVYQDNSLMSKTLASIKAGDTTHIDNVLNSVYGVNSRWATALKNNPQSFNISLYGNYKQEDVSDSGDKSNDLKDPDKFNDQINKYLKGIYIGLAEADKSQQYYIQGPTLENAQVKQAPDGLIFYENVNAINIIYNYFADEVNRMVSAYKQLNGETPLKPEEQIMFYHYAKTPGDGKGNWNKSYMFPTMDLEKLGVTKGGIPVPLAVDNKDVKKYISGVFMDLVEQDLKTAEKYGIIIKEGAIYKNRTLDNQLITSKYENNVVKAIADYTLNSIIANVEFTKLFTGDPALYKNKGDGFEDFRKRIPAIIASGKDMRIFKDNNYEVRSHYTSATVENIMSPSQYFTDENNLKIISKVTGHPLSKIKDLFKSYGDVNQTDAQAWITIDTYKERMLGFGKWSPSHEEAYQRIIKGSELSTDVKLFAQPLKTVHTENKMHHGVMTMQYNKQSEAVLLPSIAKQIGLGSILEAMKAQKIDHIITLDGKKVGAMGVSKVTDTNGKILSKDNIKFTPNLLSNRSLFLQQDLPTKKIKEIQVGSQHVKNVLALLDLDGKYDELTGLELYEQYNETIGKLSDLGLFDLQKDLGYNDVKLINKPKFYNKLAKTFNGKVSRNILESFNKYIPLDAIPQLRTQIQNKLNAMVTKETVKLKQLGGAMIQTSNFGFVGTEINLNTPVKDGIIWFKNPTEELQPARLVEKNSFNKEEIAKFVELKEYLVDAELSTEQKELIKNIDVKNLEPTEENMGLLLKIYCI